MPSQPVSNACFLIIERVDESEHIQFFSLTLHYVWHDKTRMLVLTEQFSQYAILKGVTLHDHGENLRASVSQTAGKGGEWRNRVASVSIKRSSLGSAIFWLQRWAILLTLSDLNLVCELIIDNAYLQPGVVAYTCNPISGEAEADGSLGVLGQSGLYNEFKGSQTCIESPCLKQTKGIPIFKVDKIRDKSIITINSMVQSKQSIISVSGIIHRQWATRSSIYGILMVPDYIT